MSVRWDLGTKWLDEFSYATKVYPSSWSSVVITGDVSTVCMFILVNCMPVLYDGGK
jgi:hypothetical protein